MQIRHALVAYYNIIIIVMIFYIHTADHYDLEKGSEYAKIGNGAPQTMITEENDLAPGAVLKIVSV